MKQQAIQYLALDVHQATVVARLRDEHGRVVTRATVATEAKAILTVGPERRGAGSTWPSRKEPRRNGCNDLLVASSAPAPTSSARSPSSPQSAKIELTKVDLLEGKSDSALAAAKPIAAMK
jgi:hypothetical protein